MTTAQTAPLALVSKLSVTYQPDSDQAVCALREADFAVAAGERIGILGESGSGKSTLAAALLGLLPPNARCDGGTVQFLEQDMLRLPESKLRRIRGAAIALIPQDPAQALNPVISVADQIAEVLRAHVPLKGRDRRTRVHELLAEVGFDNPQAISRAYPHELSGGQRQRVVIAQAIACRPALVIADEPTSKLDASLRAEVLSQLLKISESHEMALVVITHDPTALAGLVERVAVMYAGCVIEVGPIEEVFSRPFHPYTEALVRLSARYLPGAPRKPLPVITDDPSSSSILGKGCLFAPRCPEKMTICLEHIPSETTVQSSHNVSCFKYDH